MTGRAPEGGAGARERWITVRGEMSGAEVDAASAAAGVTGGRERRRRWQRFGLFPLPAWAGLRTGAVDISRRPAYHPDAPVLAAFVAAMIGPGPGDATPQTIQRALEAVRLLRLRAGARAGSEAGEDRFYDLVRDAMEGLRDRRAHRDAREASEAVTPRWRPAGRPTVTPRWLTVAGALAVGDLEDACRRRGVRLDRARRTYWQAERIFPQPQRRRLRPPDGRGGVRGYYHAGVVDLACLIDYATRADHAAKREPWRCSARDLAPVLATWRAEAEGDDGTAQEEALYGRIAALMPLVREGAPLPGFAARHRDVLPDGQRRLGEEERETALSATARVAEAIVNGWMAEHAPDAAPDRLVVWFRLERAGPESWRIADAGARPTSHERQRARGGEEPGEAA